MRHLLLLALLYTLFPEPSRAAPPPQAETAPAETGTVECTFTNPAYSGTCTVSEVTARPPRAACRRVLACLNNPRCVTKTYCDATTVRGGWKLTSARAAPRQTP